MSRVTTRTQAGFTHFFGLDLHNNVPEYFTGTWNGVARATGITGQINATTPTAVVDTEYYVCTTPGVVNDQVFHLGHVYLGVGTAWVDQTVTPGVRMVPTVALAGGQIQFEQDIEYTYFGNGREGVRNSADVTYTTTVPGNTVLPQTTNNYMGGYGNWRVSGDTLATTPTGYAEAPTSTMRYGVGQYNVQASVEGTLRVYVTTAPTSQLRHDPRACSWKQVGTSLANGDVVTTDSPITGVKVVFSAQTPGTATLLVN